MTAYEADETTGALTFLSAITSAAAPDTPRIVAHPSLPFIYTVGNASIDGFSFDKTTGTLTRLSGFPLAHGYSGYSLLMNSTGTKFFHGTLTGRILSYSVNQSTGALTSLSDSVWQACYTLVLSTDETKLYCVEPGNVHTATLSATGAFSAHAATVVGADNGLVLIPGTSFLFSSTATAGIIYRHTINAGTQNAGAGANTGLNLSNIRPLAHPSGSHLILPLTTAGGEIRSYSVNSTTGVLTLTNTLVVGIGLRVPVMSVDGAFVYFPSGAASVGSVSFSSGTFSTVTGSPFSTQGNGTPMALATAAY